MNAIKSLRGVALLALITVLVFSCNVNAGIQSSPKKVMKAIFKAAKKENYSTLSQLCAPDGKSDGDTKKCAIISCFMANAWQVPCTLKILNAWPQKQALLMLAC